MGLRTITIGCSVLTHLCTACPTVNLRQEHVYHGGKHIRFVWTGLQEDAYGCNSCDENCSGRCGRVDGCKIEYCRKCNGDQPRPSVEPQAGTLEIKRTVCPPLRDSCIIPSASGIVMVVRWGASDCSGETRNGPPYNVRGTSSGCHAHHMSIITRPGCGRTISSQGRCSVSWHLVLISREGVG